MLITILKIVQAAQPPPPPLFFLLLFTSLGVKKIPKVKGFKVEVKVLNEMYACEIPKIHLEIR